MLIPIEKVVVGEGRRPLRNVDELAASIAEVGLLNPITVANTDGYRLIAGYHRLEACKRLGWTEIPAEVVELDGLKAELAEIDENLIRNELTALERAEQLRRRKEVYEALHPEAAKPKGGRRPRNGEMISPFSQDTAAKVGVSPRTIQQDIQIATQLADDVKEAIRETPVANSKVDLLLLARLNHDEQRKVASVLAAGRAKGYERARQVAFRDDLVAEARRRELEAFAEMVEEEPELKQYAAAVEKGGLLVSADWFTLHLTTLQREFTGQPFHYPKYSGAAIICPKWNKQNRVEAEGLRLDRWLEDLSVPLFTEEEWTEFWNFDERAALEELDFPGREWFDFSLMSGIRVGAGGIRADLTKMRLVNPLNPSAQECPLCRRDYDPAYGRMVARYGDHPCRLHGCHYKQQPVFVKRGWGKWRVVEFNDGGGGRTRRRFFVHDHIDYTLIQQAMDTIDPFAFSAHNFHQLKIWEVQPHELSWFYCRRKTISREEMIVALEADLETLRNAQSLTEEEFTERVLDYLQQYLPEQPYYEWREGVCGYPRRPDGTVDAELVKEMFDFPGYPVADVAAQADAESEA